MNIQNVSSPSAMRVIEIHALWLLIKCYQDREDHRLPYLTQDDIDFIAQSEPIDPNSVISDASVLELYCQRNGVPSEDLEDMEEDYDDILQIIRGEYEAVAEGLENQYSSRHYEVKFVATQLFGVWIGWPYWYGGGKYGVPEEMPWLEEAVFLNAEDVVVVKKKFTIQPNQKQNIYQIRKAQYSKGGES